MSTFCIDNIKPLRGLSFNSAFSRVQHFSYILCLDPSTYKVMPWNIYIYNMVDNQYFKCLVNFGTLYSDLDTNEEIRMYLLQILDDNLIWICPSTTLTPVDCIGGWEY